MEQLKRREIGDSKSLALRITELFRDMVEQSQWTDARNLFQSARKVGKKLMGADKMNFTVGNVVKRVYHMVREECKKLKVSVAVMNKDIVKVGKDVYRMDSLKSITEKREDKGEDMADSLEKIEEDLLGEDEDNGGRRELKLGDKQVSKREVSVNTKVKNAVLLAIEDLIADIECVHEQITNQAKEHIHSGDVILTYGCSGVMTSFFDEAKQGGIIFEVVVCESAPSYLGHKTAKTLAEKGISTTVIPDSAIFALMSRVDKVIFSTHAIMANGGLVTHPGAYMMALAA